MPSSGFWAGAVPPWAYVVGGCLIILGILLGMWVGYERGFRHAEEEARWAREQAKARQGMYQRTDGHFVPIAEVAYEARLAHEDQALTLANDGCVGPSSPEQAGHHLKDPIGPPLLEPTRLLSPEEMSWTGEIQRMTAAFEEDMARMLGGTDPTLREITR